MWWYCSAPIPPATAECIIVKSVLPEIMCIHGYTKKRKFQVETKTFHSVMMIDCVSHFDLWKRTQKFRKHGCHHFYGVQHHNTKSNSIYATHALKELSRHLPSKHTKTFHKDKEKAIILPPTNDQWLILYKVKLNQSSLSFFSRSQREVFEIDCLDFS